MMTRNLRTSAAIALSLGGILIAVGAAISTNLPDLRVLGLIMLIVGLLNLIGATVALVRISLSKKSSGL